MIAVDTNVLVYAHRARFPQHARAVERLSALADGEAAWGLPVFVVAEFIRVMTHPRLLTEPFTVEEASEAIDGLLAAGSSRLLTPGERFWPLYRAALREAKAAGNLAFDAQIVALCRESGVSSLLTEDRDFARFKGFRFELLSD